MSRLPLVDPSEAEGKARELLDSVKAKVGRVPNMMKAMAAAPAVLEGYMGLSGALGKGTLDRKLRERIALALAETNGCHYCVAAHSLIGKHAGLDEAELLAARRGHSADPKAEAGLDFARLVLERRGDVERRGPRPRPGGRLRRRRDRRDRRPRRAEPPDQLLQQRRRAPRRLPGRAFRSGRTPA